VPRPAATTVAAGPRLRVDGPRATVILGSGPSSAGTNPVPALALAEIGRRLTGDVRVVVLAGGVGAFRMSAGLSVDDDAGPADTAATLQAGVAWLARPDLVSVAAVAGPATGPGIALALACDLRLIADDASFAMTEVVAGTVPGMGGSAALVAAVGYPRALELCLTGRAVGAPEAVRLGLAETSVPPARLDAAVDDLVAAVLAAPREAVTEVKALLRAAHGRPLGPPWAAEREAYTRTRPPGPGAAL
jgi:enoyl-CoA hydratase/carnithine racemase